MSSSNGNNAGTTQTFGLKAPKTADPLEEQYGHEGMRSRLIKMSQPTPKKDLVNQILSSAKKGQRTF